MIVHSITKAEPASPAHASPDEQVAGNIVAALLEAGLIDTAKQGAVIAKLASGKMKAADWKSLLELKKSNGHK